MTKYSELTVRAMAIILATLVLLAGCTANNSVEDSGEMAMVYYTGVSGKGASDPLIASQLVIQEGDSGEETMLAALWAAPSKANEISAMPEELEVERWENDHGKMKLWLSTYYDEMSGIEKTIATAALVHSLCSLEAVDSLTIYVGENEIHTDMTGESLLLYDKEADPYEREVKVFFSDEKGEFLYDYTYIYTVGGEEIIEQYVMDVLLSGDLPEDAVSYIPEATEVNEIYVEDDGICTLDLSADFYEGRPDSPVIERAVIYSIVNTLTAITGINSVQFLIDGEKIDYYVAIPLDKPVARSANIHVDSAGTTVTVFMWSDVLRQLVELPAIAREEQETEARYVMSAVNGWADEAGYTNPVPAGTGFYAATQTVDGTVVVNLTAEFYSSPASDSAENMERAIRALATALVDVYSAESIRVVLEGEDIRIDDNNLSEPMDADSLY